MNAAQMEKEFEIAYESIASNGAPGYEAYEKSILLTQAQNDIIKELVASGAEKDDIRALVIGPHIKTTSIESTATSYIDPGLSNQTGTSGDYMNFSYATDLLSVDLQNVSYSDMTATNTYGSTILDTSVLTVTISNVSVTADAANLDITITDGSDTLIAFDYTEIKAETSKSYTFTADSSLIVSVNSESLSTTIITFDVEFDLEYPIYSASTMYPTGIVFEKDVSEMWLIVNERIKETSVSTPIEVKPVEHTFLDANINNPFKKPQTGRHFWRLLQYGETTDLFTTPNFVILGLSSFNTYYINYLEKPTPIMVPATSGTIDGVTAGNGVTVDGVGTVDITDSGLDCAFNSLIHRDVVKRAAQLGAAYVSDPESFQLLMNSYNRT